VGLHRLAHLGDRPLGRDAEDLGQREGTRALDQRGHPDDNGQRQEEIGPHTPHHGRAQKPVRRPPN